MRWMTRLGPVTLVALGLLVGGCGKKTMQAPQTAPTQEPVQTPPTPPPPPPPPPAHETPAAPEMSDVYYDYDSATLRDDARSTLTENGRMLVQATSTRVTVEGHCDERGSVDYNLALGERRAAAAKDFLVSYGVGAERIETISYGENRPFALGHDEASWAQNRRAHFVVNP